MSSTTRSSSAATSPGAHLSGTIAPFGARPSAPFPRPLFEATADALVCAFHLTAAFPDPATPAITLDDFRKRWGAGLPAARKARRTLIDLGYWVEVETYIATGPDGQRLPRPERRTFTRASEVPLALEDLAVLAAEYPRGTRLECGGQRYLSTADGLVPAGQTDSEKTACRSDQAKHPVSAGRTGSEKTAPRSTAPRGAENCTPVRPAVSLTGVQKTNGRSDLVKQGVSAGGTDSEKTAPYVCKEHDEHACMMFWLELEKTIHIDPPGRRAVEEHVEAALGAGWGAEQLAAWAARQLRTAQDRSRVANPAGFVVAQLREIPAPRAVSAAQPRPNRETPAPLQKRPAGSSRSVVNDCAPRDEPPRPARDQIRLQAVAQFRDEQRRKARKPRDRGQRTA